MKILHCADLHLGCANKKLNSEKQRTLRNEGANNFCRVIEYAKTNQIDAILICGDIFHNKNGNLQLRKLFISTIGASLIPTYIIGGNHDGEFLKDDVLPDNMHILVEDSCFQIENVYISANEKNLIQENFNIVLKHGDISNGEIDLKSFKNRNIDYLALGHIHACAQGKLDERGAYAYSGCLTSCGFDECGQKGFIILDTANKTTEFKTLPQRQFEIVDVCIDNFLSLEDLSRRFVNALKNVPSSSALRLVVTGFYEENQDKFLSLLYHKFYEKYFYFEIKDKTKLKLDIEKLKSESLSFKAEFLKLVEGDVELGDEDKNHVSELGIKALRGDSL